MFQKFSDATGGRAHAARLSALRGWMAREGIDAVLVPRADAHQGEYVAPSDARLAWLTGFTGSAGFAVVTATRAGVFIDGRYRVQVRRQIDLTLFAPVPWPDTRPGPWLADARPNGGRIGFDPWLHTRSEVEALDRAVADHGLALIPLAQNPIDAIWTDRPPPPQGPARVHPAEAAGETAEAKRLRLAALLRREGQAAVLLTLPDSISWLLNIRGSDIPCNPVVQSFAVLSDEGQVSLFADAAKFDPSVRAHLGDAVAILPPNSLLAALGDLEGPVRLDPATAPEAAFLRLEEAGTDIVRAPDPCVMPKARKNAAELAGMQAAHLRDGVAMVRLLAWLDRSDPLELTEISVVTRLEALRRDQGILDISFDTICGAGPNGAIVHYRVTEATDRRLSRDQILLIDSGGQYRDGTTDITRTVSLGAAPDTAIGPFTAVLRGMIALSRARFPEGVAGAHLDALARQFLWQQGLDFDHGTGHGVGAALCVHEGPARISRASDIALAPGMILSNEPGYYREEQFGIRIENLVHVTEAEAEAGRRMLGFQTLTLCPIDRRLIEVRALSADERAWLDRYHAEVRTALTPHLDARDAAWLEQATAPLGAP